MKALWKRAAWGLACCVSLLPGVARGQAPVITNQPQSQSVAEYTTVSLFVGASGASPLSYQWRLNGTNVVGGITSGTGSNYGFVAQAHRDGDYTVVVSNAVGVVTSDVATVTVILRPTVSNPQSQMVEPGAQVVFALTVGGTPPLYPQWLFNSVPLPGETNATLVISNAQQPNDGLYSLAVSNAAGAVTSGVASLTTSVSPEWFREYSLPTCSLAFPIGITTDSNGSVYVGGQYCYDQEFLALKYDTAGNEIWARRYSGVAGSTYAQANAMTTDNSGNIILTGWGYSGGGPGEYAPTIKFNSNGQLEWEGVFIGIAGPYYEGRGVALDSGGNVYVTGYSGSGGPGTSSMSTWKYNPIGQQMWVRYLQPGAHFDTSLIKADGSSNVIVIAGSNSVGSVDMMIIKYDTAGNELWTRTYDGPAWPDADEIRGLEVDAAGNIYVSGKSYGTNSEDIVTLKYDPNGTLLWVRRYDGLTNSADEPFWDGLRLHRDGDLAVVGNSDGNLVILRYDTDGNLIVARNAGPSLTMNSQLSHSFDVKLDRSGRVYVVGDGQISKFGVGGGLEWKVLLDVSPVALTLDENGYIYLAGYKYGEGKFVTTKYRQHFPPEILQSPHGTTLLIGTDVLFAASVVGPGPLTYQWRQNGTNLIDDGRILGANSPALSISNLVAGDSGLYTLVVSNAYGSVTSSNALLTVNIPPAVSVVEPVDGAWFAPGSNVVVTADAGDADGTVALVEFYSGASLLGTATNPPFSMVWSNPPIGSLSLTARATDNFDASVTSAPVQIFVLHLAPVVVVSGRGAVLRSPEGNTFPLGATVTLTANAARYHRFSHWSDGDTNPVRTVQIQLTNVLTAVFTNTVPLEHLVFKLWDLSYGGENEDILTVIEPTDDGGYILGGNSSSDADGNKTTPNPGQKVIWLIKVDAKGQIEWQRDFGRYRYPELRSIRRTADEGYLAGGSGAPIDEEGQSLSIHDYYVFKLDRDGNLLWERTYGGDMQDELYSIEPTPDGGALLGGSSRSGVRGDNATDWRGDWLVRIDANGVKEWDRHYGGAVIRVVRRTGDGGYIMGGAKEIYSPLDAAPLFGSGDYWLVKLDADYRVQWAHTFGGSGTDDLRTLAATLDRGFIVGGYSTSLPGGILRLDSNGRKIWENVPVQTMQYIGGIAETGGGFVFAGTSSDGIEGTGDDDFGVARTDGSGNLEWPRWFGGEDYEEVLAFQVTPAGDLIIGGSSASHPGRTKSAPLFGSWDYWVVKAAYREGPAGMPALLVNGQFRGDPTVGVGSADQLELVTSFTNGFIFYSLDGSDPAAGAVYFAPFTLAQTATLRAIAYDAEFIESQEMDPITIAALPAYPLTFTSGGGTVVLQPPGGSYVSNTVATATATNAPGWTFLHWEGDASGTNLTVSMRMDRPKSIRAVFGTPLRTNMVGNGTITLEPARELHPHGSATRLTAIPQPGNFFRLWGGAVAGQSNSPLNFVVTNANPLLTALFAALPADRFGLTLYVNGPGSVAKTPLAPHYSNGQPVAVSALAPPGTFFTGWSEDAAGRMNPLSVLMDASKSITANFIFNEPPMVAITTPTNQTVYAGPAPVPIAVAVSDSDGTVARVDFFAGTNLIGAATEPPFTVVWTNVTAGEHTLVAVATDDVGASSASMPVTITVRAGALDQSLPDPVPAHDASLRVVLVPAEAQGQWRFAWEPFWRDGGTVATGLPAGNYPVEFRPVSGFLHPAGVLVSVTSGSQVTVTNSYTPAGVVQTGSLAVRIEPPTVATNPVLSARGQWRRQGEINWHDDGEVLSSLNAGPYIIECKPVAGTGTTWITPTNRIVEVLADITNEFVAAYLIGTAPTGVAPAVLPFPDYTTETNSPYLFGGQLLSEIGYGSGHVVRERVVLTAAHVVFDDSLLTWVTNVSWFFQRHAGVHEPPPQSPRGWYVLDGYAGQRANEMTPGVSSLASRNLDVAALYFTESPDNANLPGRGGWAGFLASDTTPNTALAARTNKALVGYPLDGVPAEHRGRQHATPAADYVFDQEFDKVYSSPGIVSFPGNSGGALCVEHDGRFYPAAVYLGGVDKAIVRVIDSQVVDLINRAQVSGETGGNSTAGGVVRLGITLATNDTCYNYATVTLLPAAAVTAGARWRVGKSSPTTTNWTTWTASTNTRIIIQNRPDFLELTPAEGFLTPDPGVLSLQCLSNSTETRLVFTYVQVLPRLDALPPHLVLSGVATQTYRVEFNTRLGTTSGWVPYTNLAFGPTTTNVVISNALAPAPTNRFYRAVRVP